MPWPPPDPATVLPGDCRATLATLPPGVFQTCVTSPPYWSLRDYGCAEQIGVEASVQEWVQALVDVFRAVRRVLRPDGTCWINLGDAYSNAGYSNQTNTNGRKRGAGGKPKHSYGLGPKQLLLLPARVALALQADGWICRAEIIWAKQNPLPESVTDRPTKAHEQIYLFSRQPKYYYDQEAVREAQQEPERSTGHVEMMGGAKNAAAREENGYRWAGAKPRQYNPAGRNLRDVWPLSSQPFNGWGETVRQIPVASDAVSDGTKRITSADCPVHGDRPVQVPTGQYDRNGAAAENHTIYSDGRPAPTPVGDSAHTAPPLVADSAVDNSDSPGLPYAPSAIPHSNGSHKTAPAPETMPPYTLSDETPVRTGYTSMLPGLGDSAAHSPVNSTDGDDSGARPSAQTRPRIAGTSSSLAIPPECTCSFYNEVTEKTSHFATFPDAIPRRAIRAGTSARGQCPACGAPWRRVTTRELTGTNETRPMIGIPGRHTPGGYNKRRAGDSQVETTGWAPTCVCGCPAGMAPDDWEEIETPTGERSAPDPSLLTGRAGYNRPRGPAEGSRPITRYEQRRYATQLRNSPHRDAMAAEAGSAFDHYLRTDRGGARPVPPDLLTAWLARGWLDPVILPEWTPLPPVPQWVLDPFAGSGTTLAVARSLGRAAVGCELQPAYLPLSARRIAQAPVPLPALVEHL